MRWLLQLKAYVCKPIDPLTGALIIVAMFGVGLAVISATDNTSPRRTLPPVHFVTITIDQTTVTVPVFGTNVEFKVQ